MWYVFGHCSAVQSMACSPAAIHIHAHDADYLNLHSILFIDNLLCSANCLVVIGVYFVDGLINL